MNLLDWQCQTWLSYQRIYIDLLRFALSAITETQPAIIQELETNNSVAGCADKQPRDPSGSACRIY